MMRSVAYSMICLAMIGAVGCCHFPPEPTPSPDMTRQKFLFETEYLNQAWGYHHNGIEIENDGRVYRYQIADDAAWKPNDKGIYSASELVAKYASNRTYLMTIPIDTLIAMYKLIAPGSGGSYSDTLHVGADMGGVTYSCWTTNGQGGYRRLALRLRGDFRFDNLSPSAATIADWLDTIWQQTHQ